MENRRDDPEGGAMMKEELKKIIDELGERELRLLLIAALNLKGK